MKKTLLQLIVALLFAVAQLKVSAQPQSYLPTVFPQSPNSQAFVKYGDYPVNLYSGLPDITIPLYTIQAGSLQIPVTLSYHASGLKVNEPAGYVGAGWSVNAGGAGITRNILGRSDDNGGYLSTFRDAASLDPQNVESDLRYLRDVATNPDNNQYDTRPDIYTYDIPGHTGKFFFNAKDSYKVEMIPYAPLIVNRTSSADTMCFNITDEQGVVYNLGYTYREKTTTSTASSGAPVSAITAWKLERMIGQSRRDTVNFKYVTNSSLVTYKGQMIYIEDQEAHFFTTPTASCPTGYANTNPVLSETDTDSGVGEQDVSEISYKNGKVVFTLDTAVRSDLNSRGLNNIKIYSYNFGLKVYELQKTIKFIKGYYTSSTGTPLRLRLDAIEIQDKAGGTIQRYSFDYNTQQTPDYHSFSRDYWGYYNGKTNTTLIPKTEIPFQATSTSTPTTKFIGGDDPYSREPDSAFMQAGVLTGIHYPTGGYTNFKYQTNRFKDGVGVVHLTGGLRIDSIISYDNINATPMIKSYQYNTAQANFKITGFAGMIDQGFFFNTLLIKYYIPPTASSDPAVCVDKRGRSYFSEPALNLTPTEGNPVAYTNVTEYVGTPTGNTGKSIYKFRWRQDDWSGSAGATGVPVVEDYFYARGQLTEKDDYLRKSDGSYQIVHKKTNTYTAFGPDTLYRSVGMVVGQQRRSESVTGYFLAYYGHTQPEALNDVNAFPYANYNIASDDNYLTSTTTINYDLNDTTKSVSTAIAYNYGSDTTHQQIISTTHVDSKGNTRTVNNKYAFNYTVGNAVIDSMVNRHLWADPVEKNETYKIGSTTKTTSAQLSQFKFGSITGSIVPDKVSTLNIISPVTDFTPSALSGGSLTKDSRYVQMISFDKYDTQNNIAQYTPRGSTPVSILWDYEYGLPTAQVKNALYNTTSNEEAYTSFEAPRHSGWSYSGATVTDPTAPTGDRVYPLSLGSVTSPTMNTAKSYVVSLWSSEGAPTVTAGGSITGAALRTNNNWTYYEYIVPSGHSSVVVSGTANLDELRIYPADAQMNTYAYDPNGVTAMADTRGGINHFEYDPFSRLRNIKDWNGFIVKNYGYHTYDQTHGNAATGDSTFTRNNCPVNTTPGTTTYGVPANRYYAVTTASANAEALYDRRVNGQIKANTVCTCAATIQFTIHNNSGHSGSVTFSGIASPFLFTASATAQVFNVPPATYSSAFTAFDGTFTGTFTLGTRTPVSGHNATFTSVVIATGSPDLSLTVN
ncbi:MAG TPA: DUF5977 domain-containing protein [Mucilaginibacter sp.]|nr:DUF5977 domain-containing protein [Mucilaginibacter sp.]